MLYNDSNTDSVISQLLYESICNARDLRLIPGSERCPGGGNGNPLLYSCLESSIDRRAWWTAVHGVTKNQTRLSTRAGRVEGLKTMKTRLRVSNSLDITQLISVRVRAHCISHFLLAQKGGPRTLFVPWV